MSSEETIALKPRPEAGLATNIRDILTDRTALAVLVLCAAVAFLDGVDTQLIAGFAPIIAGALDVQIARFSIVFSAGLFGMMLGSLVFGLLADHWGRKRIVVLCLIVFGGGTVATAYAGGLTDLTLLRLVTGFGIGGVLPNLVALTAEYAPPRARAFMTSIMYCGYPLGGVATGLVGSFIVGTIEWHNVFLISGGLTLVFLIPILLFLPETRELRAVSRHEDGRKPGLSQLFTGGLLAPALLLWVSMFMTLMIILFVVSWINALLVREGMPISSGMRYPAYFSFGGIIGAVLIGVLMDRFSALRVLIVTMALGAVALLSMFWTMGDPAALFVSTLLAGLLIAGGQVGLQSFAALLYPPAVRSTGIGWALGMGRIGSLIGPLLGGAMISLNWSSPGILSVMAIPSAVAAGALILLAFAMGTAQLKSKTAKENA